MVALAWYAPLEAEDWWLILLLVAAVVTLCSLLIRWVLR